MISDQYFFRPVNVQEQLAFNQNSLLIGSPKHGSSMIHR